MKRVPSPILPVLLPALLLALMLACTPPPAGHRRLELYLSGPGEPGLELPELLPISHPLLLRSTLADSDSFRLELARWLSQPRLRLLDTRLLETPGGREERSWTNGRLGSLVWDIETRRRQGHRQVQLRVQEDGLGERLSGWTDLLEREDLVLGMPLADGAGLLLRLPPTDTESGSGQPGSALPDSLLASAAWRPVETLPALVDGPAQLGRLIRYPPAARRDGITGTVLVALRVDEMGRVRESSVVGGVRADLDSAARAALEQAVFTPGRDRHGPVAVWVTVPVHFLLADKPAAAPH